MFLIPSLIALGAAAYSLSDWTFMSQALAHSSYYLLLSMALIWSVLTVQKLKTIQKEIRPFLNNYWPGLLSALALTVAVFLSVEIAYKVLSDETNLLCVSKGMLFEKTVLCSNMGKNYFDIFFPVEQILDKRPFLVPFLVSILHSFLGYHPENFFILNFAVLFVLLSFAYVFFRWLLNPVMGFAAQLLILSQPIITISATSAGLELFTATYFFACAFLLYKYLEQPTQEKLLYLWINLLLFCHCRYESPIFALIILALLFLAKKVQFKSFRPQRWLYSLTPIFFLPIFWQRLLKIDDHETAPDIKPFAFSHLWDHIRDFAIGQVGTGFQYPYAALVNVLGWTFTITVLTSYFLGKIKFQKPFQKTFCWILLFCIITNLTLFLSYHFAHFGHPAAGRYFIIVTVLVSVGPLFYYRLRQAVPSYVFLLYAIVAFLVYHPVAMESRATHALHKARELRFTYEFLKSYPDKRILIVADRPSFYTVLNYGSVSFSWANKNKSGIFHEWYRNLYREVIVIQKIRYLTGKPPEPQVLDPEFSLEKLTELQNNEDEFLRISRVVKN